MSLRELYTALRVTLMLTLLGGVAYPALVYGLAQAAFPRQAETSLVRDRCGTVVGSALIGQRFAGAQWFHGRPSASQYDATASGGSNLAVTSGALADSLEKRAARFRRENALPARTALPADAITASGSGLDPDVSAESAELQVTRVVTERRRVGPAAIDSTTLRALVRDHAVSVWPGWGARRVNVLALNLALDSLAHGAPLCRVRA
jgi:K+-transporting ATPase ATPase C chain